MDGDLKESVYTHMELERINLQLKDEYKRDMAEIEKLFENLLISSLHSLHKRLVRKIIELPGYFRETDRIQNCIELFNETKDGN